MLKAQFYTKCELFCPQHLSMCTAEAFNLKDSVALEAAEVLPAHGCFSVRAKSATYRWLGLLASERPVSSHALRCLSSRRDHAHCLLGVCGRPVLVGEAWHHGASGPGPALGCDAPPHPGRHGGRHETSISSENCTYAKLTKTYFMWMATLTVCITALNCTQDALRLTTSLGYSSVGHTP